MDGIIDRQSGMNAKRLSSVSEKKIQNLRASIAFQRTGFQWCRAVLQLHGVLTALLFLLLTDNASATYLYSWVSTTGPMLTASFQVPDSTVATGLIDASALSTAPGFTASAPDGVFNNVTADSALDVDPLTGVVLLNTTNSITATNSTDTLLLSAIGYFVPTSRLQSRGKGTWKVTHMSDLQSPPRIIFIGFTNGQPLLRVTATADVRFAIQESTNFIQWTSIVTNQIVGGVSTVIDPTPAVETTRFYQVITGW
jgi:hypothetical protein